MVSPFSGEVLLFCLSKNEVPKKKDTPDIKACGSPRQSVVLTGTRLHDLLSWSRLSARPVQIPLSLLPSSAWYKGIKKYTQAKWLSYKNRSILNPLLISAKGIVMKIMYFEIHLIFGALLAYTPDKRTILAYYIRKISGFPIFRLLTSYVWSRQTEVVSYLEWNMALPKKGSRKIVVEDQCFRWIHSSGN